MRQRTVIAVIRHQRNQTGGEDDASRAHLHRRAGFMAFDLGEGFATEFQNGVIACPRQAYADGGHMIERIAQLVAACAEGRFQILGKRIAQPCSEEAGRRICRQIQINQRQRGRRVIKEEAVEGPVLAVDDGQRGDGRAVGNQRRQADQRNMQLMRDALGGIDGFAAAHADQKIRMKGRDSRRQTIHGGLRACAAERKRTQQLHAAVFNAFF